MVETHKQAVKRGKKNRASGAAFEKRVREDLEEKGWIVDRWTNNIEFQKENSIEVSGKIGGPFGKLIPAKAKWNNFTKTMMMGKGGFPDFIAFKNHTEQSDCGGPCFDVIGVECKTNGTLDKTEKQKCRWLLDNHVFSKILIAEKTKVSNRVVIVYHDFEVKYE